MSERGAGGSRVAMALVGLMVGLVLGAGGMFAAYQLGVLRPVAGPTKSAPTSATDSLTGHTTVSEDELDATLGSYTVGDEVVSVSVREAIEESTSLEAVRNADGTYEVPSADTVLAIARNRVLEQEAARRGIEATDEDVAAYARETLGTDDFSVIASGYNMSAEQVQALLRRSATLWLLRGEVTKTQVPVEPEAPAKPAKGEEDLPSATYAAYVLGIVGDEWDKDANAWASEDGPYREALRDYTISNEAATYSAAQACYDEALVQVAAAEQQLSSEWTAFVNELLANVTVELDTLVT